MYHLDAPHPSPSDQTLFKDLLKMTTAKWQTFRGTVPSQQNDALARPQVSRSLTQESVEAVVKSKV